MISLVFTNLQYADFRYQRNNIKSLRCESAFLDNVCPLCFFAGHIEIGMTLIDREVECHPERILAFTLLGVCIIRQGLLTQVIGNYTAALREGSCIISRVRNLAVASDLLGGMETRYP